MQSVPTVRRVPEDRAIVLRYVVCAVLLNCANLAKAPPSLLISQLCVTAGFVFLYLLLVKVPRSPLSAIGSRALALEYMILLIILGMCRFMLLIHRGEVSFQTVQLVGIAGFLVCGFCTFLVALSLRRKAVRHLRSGRERRTVVLAKPPSRRSQQPDGKVSVIFAGTSVGLCVGKIFGYHWYITVLMLLPVPLVLSWCGGVLAGVMFLLATNDKASVPRILRWAGENQGVHNFDALTGFDAPSSVREATG